MKLVKVLCCLLLFCIVALRGEKLNYNSCTNLLLRKSQNLLFLAPEVQWELKVYRVCSIRENYRSLSAFIAS